MSYTDDISTLKKLSSTFSEKLSEAENLLHSGNITDSSKEILEAEMISEEIVNGARLLPSTIFNFNKEIDTELKDNIIETLDIKIYYIFDGDGLYIKIPRLLPKKNGGNPIYIRTSLAIALDNFFKENAKLKFKNPSTIIFKHNYNRERPENELRDHDNIELNVVVDLIAMHFLLDDSPYLLRHYYFSSEANADSTEIFVVPNDQFLELVKLIQ